MTTAATETPATETPAVEPPAAETPAVETPAVETPAAKTADEIKAEQLTAIKSVLTLPQDSNIDPAIADRTAAIASELGLTPENAPKVFSLLTSELTAHAEKAIAAKLEANQPGGAEYAQQQERWKAEALADPVIGGGKPEQLDANTNLAKRVLATFGGTAAQVTALEQSGLVSNPAALRVLVAVGKAMKEDSLVVPGAAPAAGKSEQERLYTMYPSMRPKE